MARARNHLEMELMRGIIAGCTRGETVFRIRSAQVTPTLLSEIETFSEVVGFCAKLVHLGKAEEGSTFLYMHPNNEDGTRSCSDVDHQFPVTEHAFQNLTAQPQAVEAPGIGVA